MGVLARSASRGRAPLGARKGSLAPPSFERFSPILWVKPLPYRRLSKILAGGQGLSWGDAIKGHMPAVASLLRSYGNEVSARLSALDASLRAAYAGVFARASCKIQDFGNRNEPLADAFVKISEGGRALMTLPERGRALVKRVPEPVQLEFKK